VQVRRAGPALQGTRCQYAGLGLDRYQRQHRHRLSLSRLPPRDRTGPSGRAGGTAGTLAPSDAQHAVTAAAMAPRGPAAGDRLALNVPGLDLGNIRPRRSATRYRRPADPGAAP